MSTKTLAGTNWFANPGSYDYLHHLAFEEARGFVLQGDGQALKWASFFDYIFENEILKIKLIPTDGEVGDDSDDEILCKLKFETGDYLIEPDMGAPIKFNKRMILDIPIVSYEPNSLIYYRHRDIPMSELAKGFKPKNDAGYAG